MVWLGDEVRGGRKPPTAARVVHHARIKTARDIRTRRKPELLCADVLEHRAGQVVDTVVGVEEFNEVIRTDGTIGVRWIAVIRRALEIGTDRNDRGRIRRRGNYCLGHGFLPFLGSRSVWARYRSSDATQPLVQSRNRLDFTFFAVTG